MYISCIWKAALLFLQLFIFFSKFSSAGALSFTFSVFHFPFLAVPFCGCPAKFCGNVEAPNLVEPVSLTSVKLQNHPSPASVCGNKHSKGSATG